MGWTQKVGLTATLAMSALPLVVSIAKLVFFGQVRTDNISCRWLVPRLQRVDRPSNGCFIDTLVPIVWWISAELLLRFLCPCLVTFRPLFRASYRVLSSRLPRKTYSRSGDSGGTATYDVSGRKAMHKTNLGKTASTNPIMGDPKEDGRRAGQISEDGDSENEAQLEHLENYAGGSVRRLIARNQPMETTLSMLYED